MNHEAANVSGCRCSWVCDIFVNDLFYVIGHHWLNRVSLAKRRLNQVAVTQQIIKSHFPLMIRMQIQEKAKRTTMVTNFVYKMC